MMFMFGITFFVTMVFWWVLVTYPNYSQREEEAQWVIKSLSKRLPVFAHKLNQCECYISVTGTSYTESGFYRTKLFIHFEIGDTVDNIMIKAIHLLTEVLFSSPTKELSEALVKQAGLS